MTLSHHMGALHPIETLLVLVLAFGPLLALGFVTVIHRRRTAATDQAPEPRDEGISDVGAT